MLDQVITVAARCLPRHHCRGLIEARKSSVLRLSSSSVFRGITAAASLKHRGGACGGAYGSVFRGITAAASLKRLAGTSGQYRRVEVFRGITAAASLKLLAC